ncbi:acetyl-CoA carboxylase [Hylemonella gracilis str. Niagara R]|uniref:Acetyl-CoA carboxylase n=1 Tax=Hylemonella gracilis str. Niagara R TaxID=1458275 RepID=A0A016XIR9_9BURK|nr:acetyl-CoA carboxylase [Hylemonella gracilis]EYC51746.1 acetyl-CoA carboxylase [Hylemonella gracilis str. Niagara R]
MKKQYKVLILGASYGSLLGSKLLMAGHSVTLVCRQETADLINHEGTRVRMPVKGRDGLVEVDSRQLPAAAGRLDAMPPQAVSVVNYDLVCLAMQEPQYSAPGVRELMQAIARAKLPCMSIMNMPPLPYLARIPGLDAKALRACYHDPAVWEQFEPGLMTLCSPDPQAFRPPEERPNVLQVGLPTNFKVARFEDPAHTAMLTQMEQDIADARLAVGGESLDLPVKLKVHDSIFVPLAKWAMLLTGNYRCIGAQGMRSIREAVHGDIAQSREVYEWVCQLCRRLGAQPEDLVPFDKYAAAGTGLLKPSSAARALAAGATDIERIDLLVKLVAEQQNLQSESVCETVRLVNGWLERNRKARAAHAKEAEAA